MEVITIFIIAIGLCFDSFAVSVSSGLAMRDITFLKALRIAFFLALFQGGMPVLGWILGYEVKDYISEYDHWIAFTLLSIVGVKMIIESFKKDESCRINPLNIYFLLTISVATSIDALVVGVSFALISINTPILLIGFIIGSVTFIVAMLGILFGKKTGAKYGKRMEVLGGVILIGIGLKILLEHLNQV